MSLGLREQRTRRRRTRRWALIRILFFLTAVAVVAGLAYESGRGLAMRESGDLRAKLATLDERVQALDGERAALAGKLASAEQRHSDAEARYARDVPQGGLGEILTLSREKVAAGVSEERLISLLRAVRRQRDCTNEPVTRRFIVTTPLASGRNNSVSFAKGLVTITGEGESALNAAGKPEAWFNPALPVLLRFTDLHGDTTEARGRLPINQSMVIGDREYRFTVAVGARGFVDVTGDHCRFP